MTMPLHEDNGAVRPFLLTQPLHGEWQAILLEVTADLIHASEPGELGRMTFERVSSPFSADICFNYHLDPAGQRPRLVFGCGIPPEHLESAQSLELGQEYCGIVAASCQPIVADKQRIACDPNGAFVRGLGVSAYVCHPLMAADGRLLGTFAVASATREGFTDDEVTCLRTITNFLAQAWERFEAEQGLRASAERLRLSFSEVVSEQVGARRALAESEAQFRASFENAAIGIAHVAPDGRWLRVNPALRRTLGYPADQLVASFQDITHPDDFAADLPQIELMREGKLDSYNVDKRYLRKDGTIVWGRLTVGCVRKRDGSIDYFVSAIEDISERKAHEERIHLLMREVNHRDKNILSLVQAIARQTAAREPGNFIGRFTERIRALAANQDLLVRNEWNGVEIADLVRSQLAHFADLIGSRITLHGRKLRLQATCAQAIGLALHELATNAGKYGALSRDTGRVDSIFERVSPQALQRLLRRTCGWPWSRRRGQKLLNVQSAR
jgi:PAS domain S-box-containing protein